MSDHARETEVQRPTVEVEGLPLSEGFPIRKMTLTILSGHDAGKQMISERPIIRLGADPLCDMILSDPTVSRNHAEIRQRGQHYHLVDLNSTNGTFLNDIRVDSISLTPGATFRLGRTEVRFDVTTEKVAIRTTQRTQYDNIIGQSQALREIFSILDRVAPSELSVVIEGETGSGKELIARALHDHSERKDGPFVVFDCSAFPASLLESELFGHEKGAFTGAVGRHIGVFERADGGTLFFDELGELDMEFQAKFLRVLETGQLRRVGGEKTIEVDVRMVSATNRNLKEMVESKDFRSDLFFRLAQVRFLLPPLRERKEDIPLLIEHFLEQQAERTGRKPMFEPASLHWLQQYEWPGNIRELRNAIEKAVALSVDGIITADYFQHELSQNIYAPRPVSHTPPAQSQSREPTTAPLSSHALTSPSSPHTPRSPDLTSSEPPSIPLYAGSPRDRKWAYTTARILTDEQEIVAFKDAKEEIISAFEQQYITMLLDRTGQNISKASRKAGIDRRHFYRLLKKHDIDVE